MNHMEMIENAIARKEAAEARAVQVDANIDKAEALLSEAKTEILARACLPFWNIAGRRYHHARAADLMAAARALRDENRRLINLTALDIDAINEMIASDRQG